VRVLQILQQPSRRGAELFARQLCAAFKTRGVATRTVYLYGEGRGAPLDLLPDDRVLAPQPRTHWERVAIDPWLLGSLRREVHSFEPTIVQLNGGRAVKYGSALRLLEPKASWKVVYRNIGDPCEWIRGARKRALFRRIVFPALDGVICLTDENSTLLRSRYGVKAPMVVVPSGISPDHLAARSSRQDVRARLHTPADVVVLLYVGSLTAEKRVDRLLRALHSLADSGRNVALWIAGEGPKRHELEFLADEVKIAHLVKFLGVQSQVGDLYRAADIFALASATEGIPAVVLEAAYSGLPVVATDVGGLRASVIADESAFLVPPNDQAMLVARLAQLCDSPAHRSSFGAAGMKLAASHLIEHVAEDYLAFFRDVAKFPAHGSGSPP
jgi:glycosyltransferase involved in cell wall biosynthesis